MAALARPRKVIPGQRLITPSCREDGPNLLRRGDGRHGLFDEVRHGGRLRYVNGVTLPLPRLPSTQSAGKWCVGLPGDHSIFGRDYVPAWLRPPARVGDRPAEGVPPRDQLVGPNRPGRWGSRRRTMRGICSGPSTESRPWAAAGPAAASRLVQSRAGRASPNRSGIEKHGSPSRT